MKETKHRLFAYFILGFILLLGLISFVFFQGYPQIQFRIVILTTVFYVAWGVLYHLLKGDLHFKNVVEYLLIGGLAIVIVKLLIFRF